MNSFISLFASWDIGMLFLVVLGIAAFYDLLGFLLAGPGKHTFRVAVPYANQSGLIL